jgi:hypothetical protein
LGEYYKPDSNEDSGSFHVCDIETQQELFQSRRAYMPYNGRIRWIPNSDYFIHIKDVFKVDFQAKQITRIYTIKHTYQQFRIHPTHKMLIIQDEHRFTILNH